MRATTTEASAQQPPEVARIAVAVCGAHLAGQPLHHQLTSRSAELDGATTTAPRYRLFALDTVPPKPGLVRIGDEERGGAAIEVEVWSMAPTDFATFVDGVPSPLCIGRVVLADGTDVAGFLCEPVATVGAEDITTFGGWRAFRSSR